MLNSISEVSPGLFLSSGMAVTESAVLQRRVTLVVNAAKELPACPLGDGVRVFKVAVQDSPGANLYRHFEEVSGLIKEALDAGGGALVHCVAGVSRSAALCLAYLVRHGGMDLLQAFEQVRRARPCVRPNRGFVVQLMQWEENCRAGEGIVVVAGDGEQEDGEESNRGPRVLRDERAAAMVGRAV